VYAVVGKLPEVISKSLEINEVDVRRWGERLSKDSGVKVVPDVFESHEELVALHWDCDHLELGVDQVSETDESIVIELVYYLALLAVVVGLVHSVPDL